MWWCNISKHQAPNNRLKLQTGCWLELNENHRRDTNNLHASISSALWLPVKSTRHDVGRTSDRSDGTYSAIHANTHKLPTLRFVSICSADKQAVLKLLDHSDDIFTSALQKQKILLSSHHSYLCFIKKTKYAFQKIYYFANLLSSHFWPYKSVFTDLLALLLPCGFQRKFLSGRWINGQINNVFTWGSF